MNIEVAKVGHDALPVQPAQSGVKRRWGAPLNSPMVRWQGKRVWLIGASSGIGLACAKALHAAGANVVISARNVDVLSEWAEQSQQQGPSMTLLPLDVTVQDITGHTARRISI
jgi:shikimate 5-dehydrogenase